MAPVCLTRPTPLPPPPPHTHTHRHTYTHTHSRAHAHTHAHMLYNISFILVYSFFFLRDWCNLDRTVCVCVCFLVIACVFMQQNKAKVYLWPLCHLSHRLSASHLHQQFKGTQSFHRSLQCQEKYDFICLKYIRSSNRLQYV